MWTDSTHSLLANFIYSINRRVKKMENIKDNRRDFLKTTAKLAGLGFCGCVLGGIMTACDNDGETVDAPNWPEPDNYPILNISDYAVLGSVGGILMMPVKDRQGRFVNSGNPLIIYRMEQNKFIVLDSLCRHAGAIVQLPTSAGGDMTCPAHNAKFDGTNGSLKDSGSASGTVPPLLKYNSVYDSAKNELTIAI